MGNNFLVSWIISASFTQSMVICFITANYVLVEVAAEPQTERWTKRRWREQSSKIDTVCSLPNKAETSEDLFWKEPKMNEFGISIHHYLHLGWIVLHIYSFFYHSGQAEYSNRLKLNVIYDVIITFYEVVEVLLNICNQLSLNI